MIQFFFFLKTIKRIKPNSSRRHLRKWNNVSISFNSQITQTKEFHTLQHYYIKYFNHFRAISFPKILSWADWQKPTASQQRDRASPFQIKLHIPIPSLVGTKFICHKKEGKPFPGHKMIERHCCIWNFYYWNLGGVFTCQMSSLFRIGSVKLIQRHYQHIKSKCIFWSRDCS